MRTWFRRAGARILVAGAGLLVSSAALVGCSTFDKPKPQANNQIRPIAGFNGVPSAGAAQGGAMTHQPGARSAGTVNGTDANRGFGMNSGPMNAGGAAGHSQYSPQSQTAQPYGSQSFNQPQPNAAGAGNMGVIAASGTKTAGTGVVPAGGINSRVTVEGIQPDPTPGANVPPVVNPNGDSQLRRRGNPPPMVPSGSAGDAGPSIQPVGGRGW